VAASIAVLTLAVASLAGCDGSDASETQAPVAAQLDWLVSNVNHGSATLAEPEVEAHLTSTLLATLPAGQAIRAIRQATTAYSPIRVTGYAGRPSETSAIALIETRERQKLAIYVSVDPTPEHRIANLELGEQPGSAAASANPGRYTGRFDIGGRSMFLNCSGSGSPTVVLEAGANGGSSDWLAVQRSLATTTHVCSYDRANLPGGSSDPVRKPQTAQAIVTDLHRLLRAADVPGPYVLAGHSNGGLYARLYATTYPKEIAGLVLIDTGNYPAIQRELYKKMLTPEQWRAHQADRPGKAPFVENVADEQVDLQRSYKQLAKAQRRHPLRDVPLIVISHGIPDAPQAGPSGMEKAWQQEQVKLAKLVPGGRRIVATKSHHGIPDEQPGLIVQVIKSLLGPFPE
jgi:pimeloyl-ACP methyl ester carboxylesterase